MKPAGILAPMEGREWRNLIIAVLICQSAGVLGSVLTVGAVESWYAPLAKPPGTPPEWVFGPVWVTLYALMGIALWLVARSRTAPPAWRDTALALFFCQLFLNAAWSPLFFGLQRPFLALIDMLALIAALIATILVFVRVSRPAAWLLVPYLAWVAYAAYLNAGIWILNS